MMKFLCCGLVILSMTACTEDEYLVEDGSEKEFSANIETPIWYECMDEDNESRTYIDENDAYDSGVGTLWRSNEEIGVYSNGIFSQKNVKFTSTNDENAGTVSFRGITISSPKYAYYPYTSANDGVNSTSVKLTMPIDHEYHTIYKDLVGDFRAGVLDDRNWFSSTFTFNRLVTLLRLKVNAAGTPLEGSNIQSISMEVNNKRILSGDVTVNLATQEVSTSNFEDGNNNLTLICSNEPSLTSDYYVGYLTSWPAIKVNDEIVFTITTTTHKATFTRVSKAEHQANYLYTYTMNLSSIADLKVEELPNQDTETMLAVPVLTSMKFTAANNKGKILTRTITFNSSSFESTYTDNANAEAVCEIDEENNKISLYVPYLNNRKLIPTFEVNEGCTLQTEEGEIISGVTEVDFQACKQLKVVNGVGISQTYDVEFTNTGLPVVVINQESGTTNSESNSDYVNASNAWYKATGTKWQPKDSEWAMSNGVDNFMVYNPDGTPAITDKGGAILTEPILASTRVRGNVTQQMPKKAFAVKLYAKSGVLDMPAHKRWVLLANWKDRTMMRNDVAFGIADVFKQTFPNDGIAWNPSGQFVELVYNGVYVGNYYLCEQVKVDGNRLDINDPYDEDDAYSGNPKDYGYLLECDDAYDETTKFMTKHYIPFLFKDDADEGGNMLNYAQALVRGIEENLYAGEYDAAYEKIDLKSVVDYWLIQELMMNSEMKHPKSVYMYINNDMVYAGPIWDFDWNTLPVEGYFETDGYSYTSSMLEHASKRGGLLEGFKYLSYWKSDGYPAEPEDNDRNYMWYPMLVKDSKFKSMAAERWAKVKGALSAYAETITAKAAKLELSESENYKMWQMDTKNQNKRQSLYGIGGMGYCGDEGKSFTDAVNTLYENLKKRIDGMDYVSNETWPNVTFQKK